MVHISCTFFIHSSVNRHLGCFHICLLGYCELPMLQWILGVHILFQTSVCFLKYPEVKFLGHTVLFLVFWPTSILFSIVAAPTHILDVPPRCTRGSLFSASSPTLGFPRSSNGKESACHAGYPGLIPGSGRSPGEGNGNPLQYSCLENPMDRGVWQATVHGVAKKESSVTEQLTLCNTCYLLSLWWWPFWPAWGGYLAVVWLCISLTISDVEYLFMYLYVFGKMSDRVLIRSSAHFLIRLPVSLMLNCMHSLYILDMNPLSNMIFKYLLPCCTPEINVLHVIYIFILKKEFER